MKKLFSIFALAIITAAGFTACNDDDNEWVDPNGEPLKVISNETSFSAPASTGSIVVDTQDPVTVTSNDNGWVTTTVNGNTIEVAVEENLELEGRVATLTIKAGSKKTDVSIVQSGAIFKIEIDHIYQNNSAKTLTYPVVANLPVTFTASSDWITPTFDETTGVLSVKLASNTTKHMRQGYIEYTCGNSTGRIPVKQCVFSTDLLGDYQLNFTNDSDGKVYYYNAKITGTASNCKLEVASLNVTIPMTYNATDFTFSINAGQQVGTFTYQGKDYLLGTVVVDNTAARLTWGTIYGMTASIENGYLSSGALVTLGVFEDNGSWPGYTIDEIDIELFTAYPFTSSNRAKLTLASLINPYLLRIDQQAPAATTSTSAKGLKMDSMSAAPATAASVIPAANFQIAY